MNLKVCGMTDFEQLKTLEELRIEFAGLIFYEGSKRFVSNKLEDQKSQIRNLQIKRVGVFVNAETEDIKEKVKEYGLSYVQLHGDESPEFCGEIKKLIPVIKAVRINDETKLLKELRDYEEACDYFLFDTDSKHYGGTGKKFDWQILESVAITKPFFLSGGIGFQDVAEINAFDHPMLYAIDINSKFEISHGIKDLKQVEAFIQNLK
jgi:phosphoribosylanthranilate isomerase